jgi:putative transposase
MVEPCHDLSQRKQAKLLDIARSGLYYEPEGHTDEDKAIMRRIDELHIEFPFKGSRRLCQDLRSEGTKISRKRVQRLMRIMGIVAWAPQPPKTSEPRKEHKKYPYVLRNYAVTYSGEVWASDITYVPITGAGWCYLVVIMDWFSRRILSARVSNTLDSNFCIEALKDALSRFPPPRIFNSDQGSQYTDGDFVKVLKSNAIQISMDGKGRYLDNIFVERLWRTIKYERVYLDEYVDVAEAERDIMSYIDWYNTKRAHSALGDSTPTAFYETTQKKASAA